MNLWLKLLAFIFDLVLPITVGHLLRRQSHIGQATFDRAMRANVFVLLPLLGFLGFWKTSIRGQALWLPILGMCMQIMGGLTGFLLARRKNHDALERGSYVLSAMLSNRGVVGVISVYILFGEAGYVFAQLTMLLAPFVLYVFCWPMADSFRHAHNGNHPPKRSLWRLLVTPRQIPLLGIAGGILMYAFGPPRPACLDDAFRALIHVIAWLFMVPIGYALDVKGFARYWRHTLDLLPVKFVLTPALIFALTVLVGLEGLQRDVVVVLAFSPTAINAVVSARLYGLNIHIAVAAFVVTQLVYVSCVFPLILLFYTVLHG